MSDRTSAALFGEFFAALNRFRKQGVDVSKEVEYFWKQKGDYDFSTYQMGADDDLVELGLAKKGEHRDYPGEEVILYRDGRDWEP